MDMSGFTKLFNSILHSTIWSEPNHVRILWITMLAMANKDGDVAASVPGLAKMAGISLEETEDALARFQQPDKYSRTPDFDGRRIQATDGGWHLLNHGKYRALMSAEERREYNRRKQAERRAKLSSASMTVNDSQSKSAMSAHTEAEAEAEEINTPPLAPQGGNAPMPARNRKKASQFEKVVENTPTMALIGGWFGRKPTNLWTKDDAAKLKSIDPDPDDIAVMDQWFSKTREEVIAITGFDARQTALSTLLNNWSTAADRARAFKADSRR
jgi:hypothetical protein